MLENEFFESNRKIISPYMDHRRSQKRREKEQWNFAKNPEPQSEQAQIKIEERSNQQMQDRQVLDLLLMLAQQKQEPGLATNVSQLLEQKLQQQKRKNSSPFQQPTSAQLSSYQRDLNSLISKVSEQGRNAPSGELQINN
jgi:hypothetical protein